MFLEFARQKVGSAFLPYWKLESLVFAAYREWLALNGLPEPDEYAQAAECERVARRLAGRDSYCGD